MLTLDIDTFSDADFSRVFRFKIGDDAYMDFTDHTLLMHVRKQAEDAEVFVSLSSDDPEEIDIYAMEGETEKTVVAINISRDQMKDMAAGEYVHSLIDVRPDGLRDDIWRGTLTHAIGPTR